MQPHGAHPPAAIVDPVWLVRLRTIISPVLLRRSILLFALALGLFFRLYPITHNQNFREVNNAKLIAYINLSKMIRQDIDRMFPQFSEEDKAKLQQ